MYNVCMYQHSWSDWIVLQCSDLSDSVLNFYSSQNKTLKAIKKEQLDLVVSDKNQLSTFLMTFQELSDISLKNRVGNEFNYFRRLRH